MPGHLEAIVFLQKTLSELTAAEHRLNSIPDWMSELHDEHSERKAAIDAVEAEATAADQVRREAEAALADAQEKQKRYQEQLGMVSTQREYGALLTEIDTVKGQIAENEQAALDATELKEESESRLSTLRDEFKDLDERYNTELSKWEGEKPAVADSIRDLKARSEELREEVPRNILVFFDRLYDRSGGHALAKVRKIAMPKGNPMWHCDACSYNVRPQIVVEIRNEGALNQCDSCKKILYWEEED